MVLSWKARYVAGCNITGNLSSMTYESVVSCDSVRLVFLIAELNDLDLLPGDILNTYLNSPTKDIVFFYAGNE